jgi:hypothetical protein
MYGPAIHKGQVADGSRLRPFICVGISYLVLSVVLPAVLLSSQGELFRGWKPLGLAWSLAAGAAGAIGALGIIIAMTAGGRPTLVMPMVFGCAPIVSVYFSMQLTQTHPPRPAFYAGLILVSIGAGMIMFFQPKPLKPHGTAAHASSQQGPESKPEVPEASAH